MISKIITQANKAKLRVLQEAVGDKTAFYDETMFHTNEEIAYRIEVLKGEWQRLLKEIDFLEKYETANREKIHYLFSEVRDIREALAFWGSNSLDNIEACLPIFEENHSKFLLCVEGLKCYKAAQYSQAKQKIEEFLALGGDFFRHYLANKVYGTLLVESGEYTKGRKYLLRAVKLRPDDAELHHYLLIIAGKLGHQPTIELETEILEMLDGGKCHA